MREVERGYGVEENNRDAVDNMMLNEEAILCRTFLLAGGDMQLSHILSSGAWYNRVAKTRDPSVIWL
jgi:hypothetical protein